LEIENFGVVVEKGEIRGSQGMELQANVAQKEDEKKVIMDSGTNGDMFNDIKLFTNLGPVAKGTNMYACIGPGTSVAQGGTVEFMAVVGEQRNRIKLEHALYIPGLRSQMISMGDYCRRENARFGMEPNGEAAVRDAKTGEIIMQGKCEKGSLPYLKWEYIPAKANAAKKGLKGDMQRWHERLGHIGEGSLRKMCTGAANGMECEGGEVKGDCEACVKGKMKSTSGRI